MARKLGIIPTKSFNAANFSVGVTVIPGIVNVATRLVPRMTDQASPFVTRSILAVATGVWHITAQNWLSFGALMGQLPGLFDVAAEELAIRADFGDQPAGYNYLGQTEEEELEDLREDLSGGGFIGARESERSGRDSFVDVGNQGVLIIE